jgi:hypothetical protein
MTRTRYETTPRERKSEVPSETNTIPDIAETRRCFLEAKKAIKEALIEVLRNGEREKGTA